MFCVNILHLPIERLSVELLPEIPALKCHISLFPIFSRVSMAIVKRITMVLSIVFHSVNAHWPPGVTGKHIPPCDIIPMGIDSLRFHSESIPMGIDSLWNCSEFTPRYIFACMLKLPMGIDSLWNRSKSIPMGTYSRKYKFAATPGNNSDLN